MLRQGCCKKTIADAIYINYRAKVSRYKVSTIQQAEVRSTRSDPEGNGMPSDIRCSFYHLIYDFWRSGPLRFQPPASLLPSISDSCCPASAFDPRWLVVRLARLTA